MKIGIIGPSKLQYAEDINKKAKDIITQIAQLLAQSKHEIIAVTDKDSTSEFFLQQYKENNGKNSFILVPKDDKEFGYDWLNLELGKQINCGTWRNQPEKLNEETDLMICLGYSAGGLAEIAYSKWFNPKPILIIKELITTQLPKELKKLDLRYVSYKDIEKELK